ncbi:MAG TPA: response regulator transcription factor [Roseiflexaceae bacterium]|nr:response regulator transcription factor [Roseiflexaceae bacterium]
MSKATILVVDDEAVVRRVLSDALRRAGHDVELAACGMEALKRLAQPGVDLLLLDLQLGDIDGVEVMQAARRNWPELPIIMLTAHGSLPSAIAAVRANAADYLLKPISMEKLREVIEETLERHNRFRTRGAQLRSMYEQMGTLLQSEGLLPSMAVFDPADVSGAVYEAGPLRLDARQHTVMLRGQPLDVTPSEFAILQELLRAPGTVVSCLQLAHAIQTIADDEEEARALIRPHIGRLRRKVEYDSQQPSHILSVRGIGYRWVGSEVNTTSTF